MSELISIIVPVYNVEAYLKRCLDSIVKQTYENIEVIIVDDGSTDLSGQICDSYSLADSRFKVIHKANGGVASARNAGLDASRGDYIGFVDPDDWIKSDMFEKMYQDITENETDIVTCGYYEVCGIDIAVKRFGENGVVSSDIALRDILQNFNAYLWCRLYRRHIFDNTRFIEGRNFEDVEIMPRLIMNGQNVFFDKRPMYYYCLKREGSIVATKTAENYHNFFWSYIDILRNIRIVKPEFTEMAVKGAVTGYLVQHKRLVDEERIDSTQWEALKEYKNILLAELADIDRRNNLSIKEKIELLMSLYCPRLFIQFCRCYRKGICHNEP